MRTTEQQLKIYKEANEFLKIRSGLNSNMHKEKFTKKEREKAQKLYETHYNVYYITFLLCNQQNLELQSRFSIFGQKTFVNLDQNYYYTLKQLDDILTIKFDEYKLIVHPRGVEVRTRVQKVCRLNFEYFKIFILLKSFYLITPSF